MINLYHLKYFCDAYRAKSLMEASRANGVSHSAISQAIRSLESSLETKLLHHAKHRFDPTNEGEMLFQYAHGFFEGFEKISSLIKSSSNPFQGPLRIGYSHTIGTGIVDPHLVSFCQKHPLVEPKVFNQKSAALEQLLDSRTIDLGFGIENGNFVRFDRRPICSGNFVLAASKKFPPDLSRFLVGEKGREVTSLRLALKKMDFKPHFSEFQSWTIITELTQRGMGVGLMPDFIVQENAETLCQVHKNIELPCFELFAFFRAGTSLSPISKAFLDEFT
jgi:LysR family carnitine catabolism transcriptional activator